MQTDDLTRDGAVLNIDEVPVLKLVIAYDDFANGLCAMNFFQSLLDEFGWMFIFVPRFLKFEELLRREVAERVAQEAAEADLTVIAAHEGWDLPALVKEWLQTWKGSPKNEDGPFVALLSTPEEASSWRRPVEAHLRKVARRTQKTFLCNQISWPTKEVRFSVEIHHRVNGSGESVGSTLPAKEQYETARSEEAFPGPGNASQGACSLLPPSRARTMERQPQSSGGLWLTQISRRSPALLQSR